jgi:hypothetical protein
METYLAHTWRAHINELTFQCVTIKKQKNKKNGDFSGRLVYIFISAPSRKNSVATVMVQLLTGFIKRRNNQD